MVLKELKTIQQTKTLENNAHGHQKPKMATMNRLDSTHHAPTPDGEKSSFFHSGDFFERIIHQVISISIYSSYFDDKIYTTILCITCALGIPGHEDNK